MKTDSKNEEGTSANMAVIGSRPKAGGLPPLRRVTVADVHKVEALVRARRTAAS